MGILIDSGIFIEFERRKLSPETIMTVMPSSSMGDEEIFITSITASELLVGVHRGEHLSRRTARATFVERVLISTTVVPFDLEIARVHSRIRANLLNSGTMIGAYDAVIAATAVAHNLTLLTDNAREFGRVPGLTFVQPDWRRLV